MKQYIIGVLATSIICGIVNAITNDKTTVGRIVKLISGIIMTVAVIAPITKITFHGIDQYISGLNQNADQYVIYGESAAQEKLSSIIKEKVETYILEKAHQMQLDISVEVVLDEVNNQIPSGVTIAGNISPYAKEALGNYMENTLGIRKENQIWT